MKKSDLGYVCVVHGCPLLLFPRRVEHSMERKTWKRATLLVMVGCGAVGWLKRKKNRIRNCFNYFKKTLYYTKRLHLLLKIQTSNYLILNGLKVFQVFLSPGLNYFKYSEKRCTQHFYIKHKKENIYIFSDNLLMYTEESKHYDFFLIFQWAHLDDV